MSKEPERTRFAIRFRGRAVYLTDILLSMSGLVGFVVVWQLALEIGVMDARIVPSPMEVFSMFFFKLTNVRPDGATLFANMYESFKVAITGFGIAIGIGVPLGLFMAWYKPVDKFVRPIFEIVRPISPIAWIPLMILLLGIGLRAKAFIVFFAAFTPSVINSYTGVKLTPKPLIDVAKTCGASNWQVFIKVAIPAAFPLIFSGIRISLIYSWAVLVGAEMLASNSGLGYMILQGRQFQLPDLIIVGMLTIGLVGVVLSSILSTVENYIRKRRGGR